MNITERQNIYRNHLVTNGYECRIDQFHDLEFLRVDPHTGENRRFCIMLNDMEPYLNVALPAFTKVPSAEGASTVAETLCGAVNCNGAVVKWYVMQDDTIWAAAQIFVPSPQVGCQMLNYCVECIEASFYIVRRSQKTRDVLDAFMAAS